MSRSLSFLTGNGTEDIVRRFGQPARLFLFSLHLCDRDTADASTGPGDEDNTCEFFPGTGLADDNVPLPTYPS